MKRTAIYTVLLLILFSAVFFIYRNLQKPVRVNAEKITRRELLVTVTATSTGTIKTDKEVKITTERPGKIRKLLVDEGDIVNRENPIAELTMDEIEIKLDQVRARLESVKLQAGEKARYIKYLKKDIDAQIKETEAVLKDSRSRFNRYKELFHKGYVSGITFDTIKKERDVAEASYRRAVARRSQLDAERVAFNALKEKIKETEARDDLTRLDYNRSFITSPIDGVITSLPVKVGETLAKGAPVATVSDTANLHIEAPVDEADAAKVSKGQEVRIIMDAYPDKVFYGTVSAISPVVLGKRLESKTFRVKVDFKDHPPMLKLGMSADVEIIVGKVRDSLIVPTQSIMEVKGKRYVYMISDNKARYKEVETGLFNWNFTEVGSGLKDGDLIVTNPDTPGLKDGVSVVYKKEQ